MIDSLLIKGVDIVFETETKHGDVLIEHGKIKDIGPSINAEAETEINESGLTLLAGAIDPHVHFRDPGATHKEDLSSGSKAAASGGVTSFFDMPNTKPSTTSIQSMQEKKELAAQTSCVNYNFFMGATKDNMTDCIQAENIPGIKIYVGSSTGSLLVDGEDELTQIFSKAKRLIAIHSEDEALIKENQQRYAHSENVEDHNRIRSVEGALKCTQKCVSLAIKHQARLHICHLSTKDEYLYLKSLNRPDLISTEVTPQHLLLHAPEIYQKWGTFAQINPPIREKDHQESLMNGLLDGTIACIGSDHAPHTKDEKNKAFGKAPSGMPGVETSVPLLLTGVNQKKWTLQDLTRWVSLAPAHLFNIENKGQIKAGYDADLMLVDLNHRHMLSNQQTQSKCGWTIFNGFQAQGKPIMTLVNGQVVYREGDFFTDIKGKEVKFKTNGKNT